MRDAFEQHGSSWFAPCQELHSGATFLAASEPKAQGAAGASSSSGSGGGGDEQGGEAWQSQWAAQGWLRENPLVTSAGEPLQGRLGSGWRACGGPAAKHSAAAAPCAAHRHRHRHPTASPPATPQGVPTEREVLTTAQGLPVYRVMLRRI